MTSTRPATWLPEALRPSARALCRTMAGIHARGWCDGTGGNFSVVVQTPPQLQLLMAPSGVDKGRVRPGELILVSDGGEVIGGSGRVSAEMQLHRTIVQETGAGAVLHTHSQAATLLSLDAVKAAETDTAGVDPGHGDPKRTEQPGEAMRSPIKDVATIRIEGLEMLKGLEGIRTHRSAIDLPVLANDQDLNRLSEAARPHLKPAPHGLLIAGHGLYAWGSDLEQARRHLEILEFLLEHTWSRRLWHGERGSRA